MNAKRPHGILPRARKFTTQKLAVLVPITILLLAFSVRAQGGVDGESKLSIMETPTPEPTTVVQVDGETKPMAEAPPQRPIPVSIRESVASTAVDIQLDPLDLDALLEEDEALFQEKRIRRIGIVRQLPTTVTVSGKQSSGGRWIDLKGGGSLWMLTIESPAAEAIRVHVENLNLPKGAQIMVYDTNDPQESYGPYDARYLHGQSDLWTESVFASTVTLEYYVPPGVDVNEVRFRVQEIAHVYVKLLDLIGPKEGPCHNDVTCETDWSSEANAVAGIGTIGNGGVLFGTGSLLIDLDSETWEDYFLTANHCLSWDESILGTQADADTLEFYWFYQTSSCDGTPPNPATVPRTGGGADLISIQTISGNEHAFLRIRNETPGGMHYEGWTTGTPSDSETLTGIHHPGGSYKRISFGTLHGSSTNYWNIQWDSGVTEPGSSGSPLFNSDKRCIGQLLGGDSSCANPTGIDWYGRFNVTYPNIQRWLEIGGTINVDGAYGGDEQGTPTKPFNTVGEANNFAWDDARIKIQAGSYPETLTFSKELTVFAEGGTVTIGD